MFDVYDPLAWLWRAREAGGLARPDPRGLRAKGLTSLDGLIKGKGDGREVRQLSVDGLEAGLRPEDRARARRALREAASPAPVDPGAFTLRVTKSSAAKWALTTEVPTTLRLGKLTSHILRCMGWDEDHLSIYSLTGDEKDAATQALCAMVEGNRASANADDEEAGAIDLCLGALGLVTGHRLELLYDFGDRHRFTITVLSATAKPAPGPLPRVIRQEGVCPEQYPEG